MDMEIMVDASAIMAVILREPEGETVIRTIRHKLVMVPDMMPYEIANALTRSMKRGRISKEGMISGFSQYKRMQFKTINVNIERALQIAGKYKMFAYDACYLETADRWGLPIYSLDRDMRSIGRHLGLKMLGGKNVGS